MLEGLFTMIWVLNNRKKNLTVSQTMLGRQALHMGPFSIMATELDKPKSLVGQHTHPLHALVLESASIYCFHQIQPDASEPSKAGDSGLFPASVVLTCAASEQCTWFPPVVL